MCSAVGMADFAACLKLYHGLDLLVQHGMRPFYVFFNKVTLLNPTPISSLIPLPPPPPPHPLLSYPCCCAV